MNEDKINDVLNKYKNKRENEKEKYHTIKKFDENFIKQNRQRAKEHYQNNKDKKKEYYINNKEKYKLNNLFNYYKKINDFDKLKNKYPNEYEKLKSIKDELKDEIK